MITLKNDLSAAKQLAASILISNVIPVFDMDGVFTDASHRQICNPDGTLNLEKYRTSSTAEKIAQDKQLPMIETLRILQNYKRQYVVCTARVMCASTKKWMQDHNVKPAFVLSRDGEEDHRRDSVLKEMKLTSTFTAQQRKQMLLIDDNMQNCKVALNIGMHAIHVPFDGH
jgi:hypothetical protein